ncbi:MAG: hypothetical protein QM753_13175 [Thermomicrobiales bacterium]
MNRRTAIRIAILEDTASARDEAGCPTCQAWPGLVLIDDNGNMDRPERCPDCGRLVPIIHLLHVVGMPLDAV